MLQTWRISALTGFCLFFSAVVIGQMAADGVHSFNITGAQAWTDTGVDLAVGDSLSLTTKSTSENSACSPDGKADSATTASLPLAGANPGALIAKISQNGEPQLAGAEKELHATSAGRLFLGINDAGKSACEFAVTAKVNHAESGAAPRSLKQQLTAAARVWSQGQFGSSSSNAGSEASAVSGPGSAAGTTNASASAGLKLPTVILDTDLRQHIDELPRRVHDHAGNLGDMVNFVIVGSQEKVQAALAASDWHLADVDSKEAGLKAVLNTYQKKDYLEMPMSHLYLFDRMQDFGYEQAQAYSVVASRHHFRLWKSPFTWKDQAVWVGAGTHDIGFEKDIRTGKLTHKIDPAVDGERENIAQSLEKSGKTQSMTYYLPSNPVQEAKNASGGGYHSDGRLLVVFLK